MHRFVAVAVLLLTVSTHGAAQVISSAEAGASRSDDALPRPANDSLFRHARRLVSEGHGVAGRTLIDSLLVAADPATPAFGDALYWHGAVAATAAEAERDYRRVIVEYPLAFYSGDALLAIAELEQARGDRAGAMGHLQRFVREHPANPGRGIAALGAARLAFEQRDNTVGCAMLTEARASVAATDVELRNQIDYFSGNCPTEYSAVTTTAVPATSSSATPAASTTAVATAPSASAPVRASAAPRSVAPRTVTSYTIQVAAYDTRPDAERLVARLAASGIEARVSGTSKPFRVRLAFYRTRQEATKEAATLRKRGIVGFVTQESRPAGISSP